MTPADALPAAQTPAFVADDHYDQTLEFDSGGRCVRQKRDIGTGQLRHYFDYEQWNAQKKNQTAKKGRIVPTGDGGQKRKRPIK